MLTAIRKKLGLKVSLTLALVMLVLTTVVATYITFDQTATLEQSILKKAQLAANLGAQSYGAVLEQAADNGLLTISDVFDTNYQVVPGWDWGQNPKYHTKYDVVTDNATIVVLDKFLDDKDFIYAIGADRNGYVPTHNSIFNQPLTGNATEDLANSRSKRIFKDPVALAITKSTEDGFQQVYKRDTGEVMWDVSSPIMVKGKPWGHFRLGVSLHNIEAAKAHLGMSLFGLFTAFAAVVVGTIMVLIRRAIRPVEILTAAADNISMGEGLDEPLKPETIDEIGVLTKSVDRLRLSMRSAMQRLGE